MLIGAAGLFLMLLLVYPWSMDMRASRSASITGDEPFYLLTTQSLLRDGDLDLRREYTDRSYREFFDHPDGLWYQSVPSGDGRILSPHNPGLSVLLVPGYAAGGLRGAQVELVVLAALTFALAFVLAVRLTGALRVSWLATAAVAVTATPFVYATEIYPELPAGLLLVCSLLLLSREGRLGTAGALGVVALLSGMVWLGVKYAPLVAVLAVALAVRSTPRARGAVVALGLASAAAFVWFHLGTFGAVTPYGVNTAFAGDTTGELLAEHVDLWDRTYRLWGLFIDRRFGIARWAPVLLPALPGLVLLWRRRGTPRLLTLMVVVQLLVATFTAITMMGWWFPGRTMVTVVPLLAVGLAAFLLRAGEVGRWAAVVLALYSAVVTVALAVAARTGEVTVAVDPFEVRSPAFTVLSPLFPQYTAWGADTVALTALWLGAAAAAAAAVWRRRRRETEAEVMPGLSESAPGLSRR